MTTVSPYHTNSPEYPPKHQEVHHDKDTCPGGKRTKPEHLLRGTGNKGHAWSAIRSVGSSVSGM
jgi:hypothetical protein